MADDDGVGPLFDWLVNVFVVTHQPPTDWEYADTAPFTFVHGVEEAIAAAKEFAGDRVTHLVYDVSR